APELVGGVGGSRGSHGAVIERHPTGGVDTPAVAAHGRAAWARNAQGAVAYDLDGRKAQAAGRALHQEAPAVGADYRPAGNRQIPECEVGANAADAEDAAGVAAADSQPILARTVDRQVVVDVQLAAGQRDGTVAGRGGEADRVCAGVGVSGKDRRP